LLNLIHPNRGQAKVLGLDSQRNSLEIRSRLGYLPGDVVLYDGMTGNEYLSLMGSFHKGDNGRRMTEIGGLLELDLTRQTRAYSKGMKQKLAIIQAFMNDPELLVLDEPTLGLDPLVQHKFYDLLISEKARGKTIFLSSHILPEVERVCDRVGIVRDGQLVSIENVADLKFKKVRRMELSLSREIAPEELKLEGVEIIDIKGTHIQLKVISENMQNLLAQLSKLPIEDMAFPEATLEDTFMEFYGEDHK
jgi:ABC-2 type transport system ATP-binding protein